MAFFLSRLCHTKRRAAIHANGHFWGLLLFLAGTTPAWAEPAPVRLQLKWQHQFQFDGFLYNTEPAPAKPTWLFISLGTLAVLLALAGALAYSHKRNRTKSGSFLTCEWRNTLYHAADGPAAGAISIGADVSERILAQERLKQAKDIAEQLLADQRQFLAMLSHEIRSPLATVSSAAQLLQSRCASACGGSGIIERIQRGVRRLAAFVSNCLSEERLAQIEESGLRRLIDSHPGQGTCITVRLPAAIPPQEAPNE